MATTPYRTDAQITQEYKDAYNKYAKTQQDQANRQKAATNSQYDNAQRSNYVAYMQNQKEMPETLATAGVTGGAAETSALRARTNYENNYNNTERSRNTDLTNIGNSLRDTLNTYKMTADENKRTELANERQKRIAYQQQLDQQAYERKQAAQEQYENRYAKTISGWDSIGGIDKEIANIQKSGKDTWRIAYLRARRAELVELQKQEAAAAAAAAASSGGSSGRSYSRSSGGRSSSSSAASATSGPKKAEIKDKAAGVLGTNAANIGNKIITTQATKKTSKKSKSSGKSSGSRAIFSRGVVSARRQRARTSSRSTRRTGRYTRRAGR